MFKPATRIEFQPLSEVKPAIQAQEKTPFLYEVIKSLKDGIYPCYRGAWLLQWKYFVLESHDFKLNIKPLKEPALAQAIESAFENNTPLFFLIEGMQYQIVSLKSDGFWDQSVGEKATSWMWEGNLPDFIPLPRQEKLVDSAIDF